MMTSVELRSEPRAVTPRQPAGTISLHIDGERFAVSEVRNMSQTGVSLVVAGTLDAFACARKVTIDYCGPDAGVAVSGLIVWSRAGGAGVGDAACVLGVQLLSPNLLLTFID